MPYQATTPVSQQIGILHQGSTPVPVSQLSFTPTSSAVIIAAPSASYQIALVQISLAAGAAFTAVSLYSTTTNTVKFPIGSMASGASFVVPFSPCPWLLCVPGESLTLAFTGTGTLSGSVNYALVPVADAT
jgi:hypothetical protein